jgi:hypothetical protein
VVIVDKLDFSVVARALAQTLVVVRQTLEVMEALAVVDKTVSGLEATPPQAR